VPLNTNQPTNHTVR